jgi:hypothetical protein
MLLRLGLNVLLYLKTYESPVSTSHLTGMFIVLVREKVSLCVKDFMLMHFFTEAHYCTVITSLLQHEPDKRLELSQSPLLPSRLEDEYFKGAL